MKPPLFDYLTGLEVSAECSDPIALIAYIEDNHAIGGKASPDILDVCIDRIMEPS